MLWSTRHRPARFVIPLFLAVAWVTAGCQRASAPAPDDNRAAAVPAVGPVTMSVTAEPAIAAPGGVLSLLWRLRPQPHWHLYWQGRNDSGFAPRQKLEVPAGWIAGPLQWPAPERLVSAGDILDHVYHGELVLLQEIAIPADAAPARQVRLNADWQWLACRDSCVPGRDSLTVAIDVAVGAAAAEPSLALRQARSRLPQPLPAALVRTRWEGDRFLIEGSVSGNLEAARRFTFMPAADCGELVNLLADGVGATLGLRFIAHDGRVGPVRGLLLIEDEYGQTRPFLIDVSAVTVDDTMPSGG